MGYTFTVIGVSLLCKIAALRSFGLDKLHYWRERSSGMSSLAYFLAKDTVDHFNTRIKPLVYLSMFFFFNNPRPTITDNYFVLLYLVYCVTGIAYIFSILFEQVVSASSSCFDSDSNLRYSGVWLITRCGSLSENGYDVKNFRPCLTYLVATGVLNRIVAFVCMATRGSTLSKCISIYCIRHEICYVVFCMDLLHNYRHFFHLFTNEMILNSYIPTYLSFKFLPLLPNTCEDILAMTNKATLNVGGNTISAQAMEHHILRKQGDKEDGREANVGKLFGLELMDRNVTFALCCRTRSPDVRIYTGDGVSAFPELVVKNMLDFAVDMKSLVQGVCQQLPTSGSLRKSMVECFRNHKTSSIRVEKIPYDSKFQYLLAM
ncbi:hypothetical protein F3Y22_tig00005406pilonHSYRG00132 [Hibiscus syriacus]|uniref:Uncharacterized protein n=1 Tax=Hibiscus syriacus TaxID=106335 RepID=A0A6A3CEC1_HIBSY|nr:hypothetical protein F3Y22_tig00005406pilonHSYRG00132 [Hibiscus syriacus]